MYTYVLNIDWLSLYCVCTAPSYTGGAVQTFDELRQEVEQQGDDKPQPAAPRDFPEIPGYQYEVQPYGSRQYAKIIFVYKAKEKIAEVQALPYSQIILYNSCVVKFENRLLYHVHGQGTMLTFLHDHMLQVKRVTRVDICADFNKFYCYECVPFIKDFLSSKLRHIGRGSGQANFSHGSYVEKQTKQSKSFLNYGSMTFGKHSSDVRVYLYNKSKELAEVHDKPHIRDAWTEAGLLQPPDADVWRLEVSIKGQGIRYRNKETGEAEEITLETLFDDRMLRILYMTFVDAYFCFIRNREGITNITRERERAKLRLFGDDVPTISRAYLRPVTGSNRADRIFIKKLYLHADELRALDTPEWHLFGLNAAQKVAAATDLSDWLRDKAPDWEHPKHK